MISITLRQLRDTRQIKAWLKAGKTLEIKDRTRVVGRIVPVHEPVPQEKWPDFEARARKIFGDRVIPAVDLLIEDRESRY